MSISSLRRAGGHSMKDSASPAWILLSSVTRSRSAVNMTVTLFRCWPVLVFAVLPASGRGLHYEPEFVEPIENVTVPVGRDVKFACTVRHLGSYKVAWIHFERSAILTVHSNVITRNPRIGVSHDNHYTWYLHIDDAQESDRGRYLCQINTANAKTQSAYLNIIVPPYIDDAMSSSDVIVREGSDVILECNARGSPEPLVKWKREDGRPINLNKTFALGETEGSLLELQKISRLDMGAYLCIASNGISPSVTKRIYVSVDFPPMVWVPQQLVGADKGSSVTIDCLLESYPAALNYWSREDGQVLHDPSKYRMESIAIEINNRTSLVAQSTGTLESNELSSALWNPSYKTHLKLTIKNLKHSDFGSYRCVARNPRGETDGVIKLYQITKEDSVQWTNHDENTYSSTGKDVRVNLDIGLQTSNRTPPDLKDTSAGQRRNLSPASIKLHHWLQLSLLLVCYSLLL